MPWTYEYPRPALTVDCVVFTGDGDTLQLLLIQRAHDPFAGCWALPGGFVDMDETAEDAAHRELKEETGISGVQLKQFGSFSAVDRDPRERVVSIAYVGLLDIEQFQAHGGDDAAAAAWHPVNDLPPLAFDHRKIVDLAVQRFRRDRFNSTGIEMNS